MNAGTTEKWSPVHGYEGLYEVSNLGNVRSLVGWNGKKHIKRIKELSKTKTSTGYYKVELRKDGKKKSHKVHRLVAKAFIPNPEEKPYINHIDCDPLNNNLENLEWCTQKENVGHALMKGRIRTADIEKEVLERMYVIEGKTITEIAREHNVSTRTVVKHLDKHGIKRRTLAECNNKYNIDLQTLKKEIDSGKSNKEIAEKYNCPSNLIAVRRYRFKKEEM